MKTFLTIDSEARLEVSDLDNKDFEKLVLDINADYDGSVKSFAEFLSVNGIESVTTSSTIDFSDEYGIDEEMLESFLNSVSNSVLLFHLSKYEVIQMAAPILHFETLETEGDAREAYAAWMKDMEGVTIESSTEHIIEKGLDLEVEDLPF